MSISAGRLDRHRLGRLSIDRTLEPSEDRHLNAQAQAATASSEPNLLGPPA
jgi:hypothetical protein